MRLDFVYPLQGPQSARDPREQNAVVRVLVLAGKLSKVPTCNVGVSAVCSASAVPVRGDLRGKMSCRSCRNLFLE